MKEKHEDDAERDGCVGNIEDGPAGQVDVEYFDIKEVYVDKIDDFAVEERGLPEDDAIEHPIDEVADRAAEDDCKRQADHESFVAYLVKIKEDCDACDNGEEGQKQPAPEIYAECHPGVFYEGQPDKIPNERVTRPKRHSGMIKMKKGKGESFDEELGQLVGNNDRACDVENLHAENIWKCSLSPPR